MTRAAAWPDLRLAGTAVGTWLSAYAALHTRALVALSVGLAALAGAASLWRWADRATHHLGRTLAGVAVAVLLGVVCGSAATAARLAARDASAIAGPAAAHAPVTAELTLRKDPFQLRGQVDRPPTWLVPAWLHWFGPPDGSLREPAGAGLGQSAGTRTRVRVLVFATDPGWQELLPGQRVRAVGRLAPPRGGDLTAAVLSATGAPQPLGEPPWVQRAAGALRGGLRVASTPLPAEPGGLLPGLAVGDVSMLDPGLADDFYLTGMSHLVAVSGANLVIVTGLVVLSARVARAPPWLTALLSGVTLVGYVILCRADPSVLRAGVMAAVALVALASGRPRAAVPALGAAVILLVVADPQLAADAGFTLSVLATAGLLVLAPRWRDALRHRGVPSGFAEALVVPAAAQVAVSPVIAGLTGTISLVSVAANLISTPAVAPATVLGVLAAAVAPVWPAAAGFLAWLGSWPAWWLVLTARYGARAPAAVVPWPDGAGGALLLAGLTVAVLVATRRPAVRRVAVVVAAAVVVGAAPVRTVASGWPPAGAVVVVCAVGQGDLVVLPVRPGEAVVVDAGPDPVAADRCLRDLGVRTVPLLVITHFHADHVAGSPGVFRDRPVAAVLTTAFREPASGYRTLHDAAAAAGTPVQVARAGTGYHAGPLRLWVVGPPGPLSGTRSDANNNSVVLLAEVRGVSVLLPGDAEVELQQALRAHLGRRLRVDVLKLPHHGSPYQDPAFLALVDPAVALVPVGAENDYGHPHPPLLAELARGGTRVLRTDTDGDVAAVRTTAGELAVAARDPPAGRPP